MRERVELLANSQSYWQAIVRSYIANFTAARRVAAKSCAFSQKPFINISGY
jgi:hypothetical protein